MHIWTLIIGIFIGVVLVPAWIVLQDLIAKIKGSRTYPPHWRCGTFLPGNDPDA